MRHIILQKLRNHFGKGDLQGADRVEILFPLKGRRKKWHEFQLEFDLIVPGLRTPAPVVAIAVIYAIVSLLMIIGGVLNVPLIDFLVIIDGAKGLTVYLLYLLYLIVLIPAGIIAYIGNLKLPCKTIDDLIERIISKNTKTMLGDDRMGLKTILREQLEGSM
jgi:hypothetical protein